MCLCLKNGSEEIRNQRLSAEEGTVKTARILLFACLATVLFAFASVQASEDRPTKIVLQLSDGGLEKQVLVLNVADNLLATYGDKLALEVVAFGPGLKLMLDDNPNSARLAKLARNGVRLSACRNTVKKMGRMTGEDPTLAEYAVEVEGGVGRIVELMKDGYLLIRP
jgi:intracellular sulfur oxidation DsrE/DsrF family protein